MRLLVFVVAIVTAAALVACAGAAATVTPRKSTVTPTRQPSPVTTATAVRTTPATASAVAATPSTTASPSVPAPASTGSPTVPTPAVTRSPSVATPLATPIGTPTPIRGARSPVVKAGPVAPPVSLLMAVRAARHENYDRAVFEFAGRLPGYRVQYTQPPILQDASGLPIKIAGNAFLTVRLEPAAVHDDKGKPTMTLRELAPNLPSLIELKQTGDFEAVVGWVLGLRQQVDFVVIELKDPTRLVIDVAHP